MKRLRSFLGLAAIFVLAGLAMIAFYKSAVDTVWKWIAE